jgi:hypothetical protein
MQKTDPTRLHSPRLPHKLRVVHLVIPQKPDENRSAAINGSPELKLPKPDTNARRGYSSDAVPGNYQGL